MVAPPIIVTRAEPGASDTRARLKELGLTAIAAPMLHLKALDVPTPDLSGIHNLVFTSANGVHHFVAANGGITEQVADLTVWCVGPATTEAAHEAGFQRIVAGDGNADDLAAQILSAPETAGGFLHVANSAAAGNLVRTLQAAGRDARFMALYETVPATALPDAARAALRSDRTAWVLIHSAKAAQAFAALTGDLSPGMYGIVAMSGAAAAPLDGRGALGVVIAERPNEDALMAAVREACKGL